MRVLGYLSVTDKGRRKMLLADAKRSQLYDKRVKVDQLKLKASQDKVDFAIKKKKLDLHYKNVAKEKELELKLKAKYGLLKDKRGRPINQVKAFRRYNRFTNQGIVPRGVQDPFQQRHNNVVQSNGRFNPFAHRDPIDVYGDDGLTLFDGDKRADDDTGGLFGFSNKRR